VNEDERGGGEIMSVSDREAYEKKKVWKEKSNMEIRGMLARVEGKHRELCLEAQSRISKQDQNYAVFEILDRLMRKGYQVKQPFDKDGFYLLNAASGVEATGNTFRDLCVNIVLAGL
jgi:hypothetical protein